MRSGKKKILGTLELDTGTTVNKLSTDDTLVGDSDNTLVTEKAIKAFVENNASSAAVTKNSDNIVLNGFRIAVNGSLSIQNMVDGIIDEYEDETGIDTINSDAIYDSAGNYYYTGGGGSTADTKLLLHCDGTDASTTFTDASTSAHGNATVTGDAQVDTAQKKWGTGSLMLDGTDSIYYGDSADWDVYASNSDDWTIDLWVKTTDYTSAADCNLLMQYQNATNRWHFFFHTGPAVGRGFRAYITISDVGYGMLSITNPITDDNWHHVSWIKVSDEYGIYVDGTQVNYVQMSTTGNLSGNLYIGGDQNGGQFDGWLDEIRIQHSNIFSAAPNSGKTDTITVPTLPYSSSENLTLISDTFTAEAAPDNGRIVILEEDELFALLFLDQTVCLI